MHMRGATLLDCKNVPEADESLSDESVVSGTPVPVVLGPVSPRGGGLVVDVPSLTEVTSVMKVVAVPVAGFAVFVLLVDEESEEPEPEAAKVANPVESQG